MIQVKHSKNIIMECRRLMEDPSLKKLKKDVINSIEDH